MYSARTIFIVTLTNIIKIICFFSIDGDLANTLICLDVSENRLSSDDIYRLSTSKLKQLYASANRLMTVPESITHCHCFLLLELLDLSDNCLSCSKSFYVLSTLHNLQTLDMSTNQITFIPYLITKQVILIIYNFCYSNVVWRVSSCPNNKNIYYIVS